MPRDEDWAQSFVYAGSSAFLLLISTLYPAYWYVSIIALVPLLYRIIHSSTTETLRLGFLFGVTYGCVAFSGDLLATPVASLMKLSACVVLISWFAWIISATREKLGFNPIIVALIWIAAELVLARFGLISSSLTESGIRTESLLHRMAVLFGFLIVSFAIVCLNAALAAFLDLCMANDCGRRVTAHDEPSTQVSCRAAILSQRGFYFLPEGRAPPPYDSSVLNQII